MRKPTYALASYTPQILIIRQFVATLLVIAANEEPTEAQLEDGGKWEDLILWREIQKQVKILREEI